MSKVRKRSGHQVNFDISKVISAVEHAFESVGKKVPATFKSIIHQNSNKFATLATVERIQDEVENLLLSCGYIDVYKAASSYRAQRTMFREQKQVDVYRSIIAAEHNDVTHDNANMDAATPAGMMYKFASENTKIFGKQFLDPQVLKLYEDGYLHIHDFDYYALAAFNCLQTDATKIINKGINAGRGGIRPAKRIETACWQILVSLQTTQNEMFGGQGICNFDFALAPMVRKTWEEEADKVAEVLGWDEAKIVEVKDYPIADYDIELDGQLETIRKRVVNRVHQAMEGFIHNANSIFSRSGNQVVFSSINYGTDTSAEGRCIIRELLKCTMDGVGNGSTAIFPIQIMKMKDGVNKNPGDPNYDLYKMSWGVTAKRFFPNYLNLDASFYKNDFWKADDPNRWLYEPATMGCRTSVFANRFTDHPQAASRGNIAFHTLNLPMIALDVARKFGRLVGKELVEVDSEHRVAMLDAFHEAIEGYTKIAADSLMQRYEMIKKTKAYQYPLTMSGWYLGSENLKPNDAIEEAIKHGTLSVGFVGLAEALMVLVGKHHGEDEYAQMIGLKVVELINNICKQYGEEHNVNMSCFATPAESVAGKMEKITKKRYGTIKGITDHGYFTNSNHVPVWHSCTPKHKAEIEGPYHKITPAGHIFYIEATADLSRNPKVVDDMNKHAWKNDIGYSAINHTVARCLNKSCNFEEHDESKITTFCPVCGARMGRLGRVTGYLSTNVEDWNSGKRAEFRDRVSHMN